MWVELLPKGIHSCISSNYRITDYRYHQCDFSVFYNANQIGSHFLFQKCYNMQEKGKYETFPEKVREKTLKWPGELYWGVVVAQNPRTALWPLPPVVMYLCPNVEHSVIQIFKRFWENTYDILMKIGCPFQNFFIFVLYSMNVHQNLWTVFNDLKMLL